MLPPSSLPPALGVVSGPFSSLADEEQSFPALPVEAGDRWLVMVGVDRETSECSPRVAVGSVLGLGGRVQGQAQLSGVDQDVMDGGCVSSACWLVWGSCTGQALTPRSGRLVGGRGQPSGVTINSQLLGPWPVRWNFVPRQLCFCAVLLPGACDLTVYK